MKNPTVWKSTPTTLKRGDFYLINNTPHMVCCLINCQTTVITIVNYVTGAILLTDEFAQYNSNNYSLLGLGASEMITKLKKLNATYLGNIEYIKNNTPKAAISRLIHHIFPKYSIK